MKHIIYVFLGACSYGVSSTFVKLAYDQGYNVNQVTGSQTLLGFLLLAILSLYTNRKKVTGKQVLQLVGVGTAVGATGILYYSALLYIPASIAIVLLFQFTWIGVFIEAVSLKKLPEPEKFVSLIILFFGTVLAGGLIGSTWPDFEWIGIVFGLLSAVCYAVFIFFSGSASGEIPPVQRSLIINFGALVLTFIVFPPTFLADGSLFGPLFFWAFLLALFGPILPTLLFAVGVPHVGGGVASILGAAELPVAVLLSWVVLQETVPLTQWIGVIVILLGTSLPEIAASIKNKKRRSRRSKDS